MRSILLDEEKLELLDDILRVEKRSIKQIHERIMDEFCDHPLPLQKLESAYIKGMNATELIQSLYPSCVTEHVISEGNPTEISNVQDAINVLMAGQMDYDDHCSNFIYQVRRGNAHLVNTDTLHSLANFLDRHFCDEDGRWIPHTSKLRKEVTEAKNKYKSSEERAKERAIIHDFSSYEGNYDDRMEYLANKYQMSITAIQTISTEEKKKAKADQLSDDYNAGKISNVEFSRGLAKGTKPRTIKLKGKFKKQ